LILAKTSLKEFAKTILEIAMNGGVGSSAAECRFGMTKVRHYDLWQNAKKAGKVDERIAPLVEFLFSKPNYFTTSSCSGRLLLIQLDEKESKKPKAFFAKWHEIPKFKEVWKKLNEKSLQNLWFKQEPFVLVIGTNNLENAKKIMKICRNNGVKKVGIMSVEEGKFLVEIMGSHYLSFLIKEKSKILVDEALFRKEFETACKKLKASRKTLERLEESFRKELH
jgi:tRNA wybutosine-synthesizing protein 3